MPADGLFVLDTSAILALIGDEPGAGRVQSILTSRHAYIPFVALIEVRYITLQERGQDAADLRHAALATAGATLLREVDEPTVLIAARLKAFAIRLQATLVHKDPEYGALGGEVSLETLPFKRASNGHARTARRRP